MTQGGQTTTFTYNADGQRVKRETVTDTVVYVGSHYEARFEEGDMPQDLDGDCLITVVDIMLVAARWSCQCGDDCYDSLYDFDDDCEITVADIMKVAAHWRETCPEELVETVKYYTLSGRRVAMRKGDTLYYLFSDHLGSTSVSYRVTDGITTTQRYYPWGTIRPGPDNALPTDYTFTGQRLDESTGLMYYGARYYDPALGRFVQTDTIVPQPGNPQSLNRYSYVLNNPLRYTDPTGHAECVDEECNWVVHPVSGEIVQRRPTNSPPVQPQAYDPAESYQQATGLVEEFRSNAGPFERIFDPTSSLTQDIMYSSGIREFHEAWAEAGYPVPFEWEHHLDVREGGGPYVIRFIQSLPAYTGAQVKLGLAGVGLGSQTPEGPIDAVDGTIGSLDTIRVERVGAGWVRIEVKNKMNWYSGLRVPGGDYSLWKTLDSLKVPGSDSTLGDAWVGIVGGSHETKQTFYWWEPMPRSR